MAHDVRDMRPQVADEPIREAPSGMREGGQYDEEMAVPDWNLAGRIILSINAMWIPAEGKDSPGMPRSRSLLVVDLQRGSEHLGMRRFHGVADELADWRDVAASLNVTAPEETAAVDDRAEPRTLEEAGVPRVIAAGPQLQWDGAHWPPGAIAAFSPATRPFVPRESPDHLMLLVLRDGTQCLVDLVEHHAALAHDNPPLGHVEGGNWEALPATTVRGTTPPDDMPMFDVEEED